MNFFYRIKTPKLKSRYEFDDEWDWDVHDCGYIEAKSKKEVRSIIEEEFGEPMCMRSNREDIGKKNFYLLSIYEPNNYFDKLWNEERECEVCSSTYTKLERDKAIGFKYIRGDFCSEECSDKYYENIKLNIFSDDKNGIHAPVIYKITNNTAGMCYIGKTTQAFTFRWYQHYFQSSDTKFHQALKESHVTDWEFKVIEQLENKELMSDREQYWIDKFDSINNGYNSIRALKENKTKDTK